MIDTPGILSGEKQRIDRGYNYASVMSWFAERADLIILLFDAHKLDISDEFRSVIESLKPQEEKVRVVLNKADMINTQSLMRVYGALMWSLGKILQTPEVVRVYIGSFWEEALKYDENRKLFESELHNLIDDIQRLPINSSIRKLNDLIKRARVVKVHANIMNKLKSKTPYLFNKERKKEDLIRNLRETFYQIQRDELISIGDLPDFNQFQNNLRNYDWSKMYYYKPKLIVDIDNLSNEISTILSESSVNKDNENFTNTNSILTNYSNSLFGSISSEGINKGKRGQWIVKENREKYDKIFTTLSTDGQVCSDSAKQYFLSTKLPSIVLSKIWKLADISNDGTLDKDEFALAMYLIDIKLKGHNLPDKIPFHLIPPSKRHLST
ncbi:DgyrCDS5820 [Dimorphilus gyrociliatus]|uniref:DgyrCDS5820 n=1 Tax=Dimorphilus gyrociliatus TaxID=2664684 RepID=A0A7I8VNE2_9ANNE|nr:DgyrCDS5820 [Dimorphilus gyrociliatus]